MLDVKNFKEIIDPFYKNVIENADETAYGNVWVKNEDAIPLEQLIYEYYKHMELHIEHFNKRLEELLG